MYIIEELIIAIIGVKMRNETSFDVLYRGANYCDNRHEYEVV
jgi:hypothetical protein